MARHMSGIGEGWLVARLDLFEVSFVVRSVIDTTCWLVVVRWIRAGHRTVGVTSVAGFRCSR
jgi:hypothetical protein